MSTIYESLVTDHDELRSLLDRLVEASAGDASTRGILDEITAKLIPHSRAEETVLYNKLRYAGGAAHVARSFAEHAAAEAHLRTLSGLERFDVNWTAAARALRTALLEHIAEEETEMFAQARGLFSEADAIRMNEEFCELKVKIADQGSAHNMLELIVNMLPKRLADRVRTALH